MSPESHHDAHNWLLATAAMPFAMRWLNKQLRHPFLRLVDDCDGDPATALAFALSAAAGYYTPAEAAEFAATYPGLDREHLETMARLAGVTNPLMARLQFTWAGSTLELIDTAAAILGGGDNA